MKVVTTEKIEQIYAQQGELAKIFGISKRKTSDYVQKMYKSTKFKAGDDYMDLGYNYKIISIQAFKRLLAEEHLQWAKAL